MLNNLLLNFQFIYLLLLQLLFLLSKKVIKLKFKEI